MPTKTQRLAFHFFQNSACNPPCRERTLLPEDAAIDVADERPLASEQIGIEQQHARVLECLDQLEPHQGRAIRQAFFDGLTYAELADRMAVPLGTMKSWIRRGLLQLRGCVGDA